MSSVYQSSIFKLIRSTGRIKRHRILDDSQRESRVKLHTSFCCKSNRLAKDKKEKEVVIILSDICMIGKKSKMPRPTFVSDWFISCYNSSSYVISTTSSLSSCEHGDYFSCFLLEKVNYHVVIQTCKKYLQTAENCIFKYKNNL